MRWRVQLIRFLGALVLFVGLLIWMTQWGPALGLQEPLQDAAPGIYWGMIGVFWVLYVLLSALRDWRLRRHRRQMALATQYMDQILHLQAPELMLAEDQPEWQQFYQVANQVNLQTHRFKVALDQKQADFDRLINHLPVGVMVINPDDMVQMANDVMATLLDVPIDSEPHSYLDDVKTFGLSNLIERTEANHHTHHAEIKLVQNNERPVDAYAVWIGDAQAGQVVVVLYDLALVRAAEQMQLDFVGNVSHELKTPITSIAGFAETLLNGAKDDPKALTQFLTIILKEANRLNDLVTDTISVAKFANPHPIHPEPVNVRKEIDRCLTMLKPRILERQLKTKVEGPDDLTFVFDPGEFEDIIKNLLTNAVIYNHHQGNVDVRYTLTDKEFQLQVEDTGIGIPEDDQQRVFERFYRVDKMRSRKNGGTGLGLPIVQAIVNRAGGEITLHSQVGVGSLFTVTLPVRKVPAAQSAPNQ
ncbi:sensor histidine kinase [Schleiferilactobacillus shenzhenensis]|uniref:histidine kinase n=1 Tax=Schleiferilactobacillus shenzhenensis LY-73 TaxID=1231336 RepID=U4TXX6_9LACO|nr:ATP-binding protein [Schleiferilactobacillus shenzhenensis]ERL66197.1 PhoR [Schleiferilactobacillus shenzhenensis LY-73]